MAFAQEEIRKLYRIKALKLVLLIPLNSKEKKCNPTHLAI